MGLGYKMDTPINTQDWMAQLLKLLLAHSGEHFAAFCMNNVLGTTEFFETPSNNSSLQCPSNTYQCPWAFISFSSWSLCVQQWISLEDPAAILVLTPSWLQEDTIPFLQANSKLTADIFSLCFLVSASLVTDISGKFATETEMNLPNLKPFYSLQRAQWPKNEELIFTVRSSKDYFP